MHYRFICFHYICFFIYIYFVMVTLLGRVSSPSFHLTPFLQYQWLSRVSLTAVLVSFSFPNSPLSFFSFPPLCLSRFTLVSLRLCSAAIFLCLTEIRQRCIYDIRSCTRHVKSIRRLLDFA